MPINRNLQALFIEGTCLKSHIHLRFMKFSLSFKGKWSEMTFCLFAVKLSDDHDIKVDRAELLSLSICCFAKVCNAYVFQYNSTQISATFYCVCFYFWEWNFGDNRVRENIFLTIYGTKFVVICATKKIIVGWQIQMLTSYVQKYFWIGNSFRKIVRKGSNNFPGNFFKS